MHAQDFPIQYPPSFICEKQAKKCILKTCYLHQGLLYYKVMAYITLLSSFNGAEILELCDRNLSFLLFRLFTIFNQGLENATEMLRK